MDLRKVWKIIQDIFFHGVSLISVIVGFLGILDTVFNRIPSGKLKDWWDSIMIFPWYVWLILFLVSVIISGVYGVITNFKKYYIEKVLIKGENYPDERGQSRGNIGMRIYNDAEITITDCYMRLREFSDVKTNERVTLNEPNLKWSARHKSTGQNNTAASMNISGKDDAWVDLCYSKGDPGELKIIGWGGDEGEGIYEGVYKAHTQFYYNFDGASRMNNDYWLIKYRGKNNQGKHDVEIKKINKDVYTYLNQKDNKNDES